VNEWLVVDMYLQTGVNGSWWTPGVKQSPEMTRTLACYQRLINMEMQRGFWPLAHDCTCVHSTTHWPFDVKRQFDSQPGFIWTRVIVIIKLLYYRTVGLGGMTISQYRYQGVKCPLFDLLLYHVYWGMRTTDTSE